MSVYVHVCAPSADDVRAVRIRCHSCERLTGFVIRHYEWYGWHLTCLRCGDQWADGERLERPFARGWRRRNIEAARSLYRRYHPKPEPTP